MSEKTREPYILSINQHLGPFNLLRVAQLPERTLIDVRDDGITVADDLTSDEKDLLIEVLARDVRNFRLGVLETTPPRTDAAAADGGRE